MRQALVLLAMAACSSEETPADPTTTWSEDQSLDETQTIAAGERLVIEPGVTVTLAFEASLVIDGELVARGTEAEPITFTGDAVDHWTSLTFNDDATDAVFTDVDDYSYGSILEFVTFENAKNAVKLVASSPYVSHCTFKNNMNDADFTFVGGAAMQITEGSQPRIRDSLFEDNEAQVVTYGGAIYAEHSDPIIQDCTFRRNAAIYGGGVATDGVASPMVGNVFEENDATTDGGGASIVSSCSALLNNRFEDNEAGKDGAGLHVCVDCNPHATPFLYDNQFIANHSQSSGAGGVGAAFLSAMQDNDFVGNTTNGAPADFGWFHDIALLGHPGFSTPNLAGNWWGTTDLGLINVAVFDGNDDAAMGVVQLEPVLQAAVTEPRPRVALTTRRTRYVDSGDEMPVFLTLYNPGPARDLELIVALGYGDGPTVIVPVEPGLDGESERGRYRFSMPENSVSFTEVLAPAFSGDVTLGYGHWFAGLYDEAGALLSHSAVRFELGEEQAAGHGIVAGTGVSVDGGELHVGDARAAIEALAAIETRDLGEAGTWFDAEAIGLSGLLGGDTVRALFVDSSFQGQVIGGVVIGGETPAYGPSVVDPFLGATWFSEEGVAVEADDSGVTRVHLF